MKLRKSSPVDIRRRAQEAINCQLSAGIDADASDMELAGVGLFEA